MDVNTYLTRQNLLRAVVAIIVVILAFVCYDNLLFRLKDTSPSLSKMPDSSTEIRFHFSQPVASVGDASINDIDTKVVIKGRTVIFPLGGLIESDTTYSVVLSDIKSQWFGNSMDSINKSFTPEYVAFNELTDEDKQAQINESNSGQVDDAFISNSVFPIFNERWQIDATIVTERREAFLNVKFFEEIPDYDNNAVVKRVSDETAEKYRQEVLSEIKKRDGNPDDYEIFYDNPYLSNKYRVSESH